MSKEVSWSTFSYQNAGANDDDDDSSDDGAGAESSRKRRLKNNPLGGMVIPKKKKIVTFSYFHLRGSIFFDFSKKGRGTCSCRS